jgi:hypothetical protein
MTRRMPLYKRISGQLEAQALYCRFCQSSMTGDMRRRMGILRDLYWDDKRIDAERRIVHVTEIFGWIFKFN